MAPNHRVLKTITGGKALPFMKWKWPFIVFSLLLTVLCGYELGVKGFNYGVDFTGGVRMVFFFKDKVDISKARKPMEELGIGDVEIIPFGAEDSGKYIFRAKFIENADVPGLIRDKLDEVYGKDNVALEGHETIGPKVGEDLQRKGWMSLIVTCLLILIYIGFRFDFLFGPGAIVALIHDVFVTAAVFAFLGKEFNLSILAALLTILGYSINDTIIIYDRIRESLPRISSMDDLPALIDAALTETLSRTIVTSLTVFLVVLVLYLLGGGVLRDFALCLMIGVGFGTYSSLFIASPVYLWLQRKFPDQGLLLHPKKS